MVNEHENEVTLVAFGHREEIYELTLFLCHTSGE